jgi:Anti-sigma-28 factor, FlgM
MPDISSIGHGSVGPVDHPSPTSFRREDRLNASALPAPPSRPGDRVELSDHARYLDRLRQLPDTRIQHVDSIRRAIADGSYDTDEKLGVAIDELINDIMT